MNPKKLGVNMIQFMKQTLMNAMKKSDEKF